MNFKEKILEVVKVKPKGMYLNENFQFNEVGL